MYLITDVNRIGMHEYGPDYMLIEVNDKFIKEIKDSLADVAAMRNKNPDVANIEYFDSSPVFFEYFDEGITDDDFYAHFPDPREHVVVIPDISKIFDGIERNKIKVDVIRRVVSRTFWWECFIKNTSFAFQSSMVSLQELEDKMEAAKKKCQND